MYSDQAGITTTVAATAAALAVGASLMFLLDPRSGRRRRALLVDQMNRRTREGREFTRKVSVDAQNRIRGLAHRSRAVLQRESADGEISAERSGSESPGGPMPEYLQDNWAPAPRVLAGLIGLGLVATGGLANRRLGSRSGTLTTTSLGIAGTALLLRAISNRPFSRLLSRATDAEDGFLIQKSLHIYAETDELYSAWRAMENFPGFMSHLREVTKLDERHYRWSVDGPGGVPVSWESEITADVPNELIAWRTVPGSVVQSSGVVQFEPTSVGGTRIHLRMTYRPPADMIGHAAAVMFGADPRRQIDEDLLRFKSFMETGKTTGREGTVLRH
ncbi:SRPBCC family protein [Steroidobacter sp. S1-65]|uniref:SRPBCC family protein n=1 Tax=Steroidobacter gossypii TaxID=2805490 RepID=A0ABS1WQK6_9GAMM|nr:SRPBCC family protein [Steroidobacter gossypii]MBM0103262.1 SRPBCC family protein [Steroidobacter gossypii]